MRNVKIIVLILVMGVLLIGADTMVTIAEAQHRLPPVIYSIDFPQVVQRHRFYDFRWTVMGYHDSYDLMLQFKDSNGDLIDQITVSPYQVGVGEYGWQNVQSSEFFYQVTQYQMCQHSDDYITVRFFASPVNDPINNSFLSVLIPGGLGYEAGDTAGRKIKLEAQMAPLPRAGAVSCPP